MRRQVDWVELGHLVPNAYSSSAAGGESAPQFVVFTVTVVNGSTEKLCPAMFTADLQSGNREADKVYDSANGIGAPTTVVLPGRSPSSGWLSQ